jgi:hypothetical protein
MRSIVMIGIMMLVVGCAAPAASPTPTSSPTPTPSAPLATPTTDPRAELCGAGTLGPVLGQFAVDRASEVRAHIPRMGTAPELDQSDQPAYVVIFDGPVVLAVGGGPGRATEPPGGYSGVVCVALDVQPIFYTDVDTAGWRP